MKTNSIISMSDIEDSIKQNRLIALQAIGVQSKRLEVDFDKTFIIYYNQGIILQTINKIVAVDTYNGIDLVSQNYSSKNV